jgi:hypothetical protein
VRTAALGCAGGAKFRLDSLRQTEFELRLTEQPSVRLAEDSCRDVQKIKSHPEADLLKVAHHGSATSTILPLLEKVHPAIRGDFCRDVTATDICARKFFPGWKTLMF